MAGKKAGESGGSHRRHLRPSRPYKVFARFSEAEMTAITEAAKRVGLTPTSYTANAAVSEASGGQGYAALLELREALTGLLTTKAELRRVGSLLNQAVTVGHASGVLPSAVEPLVARVDRLASEFESLLALVAARLP